MVLAGQAKSSPAVDEIKNSNNCSYKSSLSKSLKDHIIIPHLIMAFQCDQCYQALTEKNCLRLHIQLLHENFSSSETNALSRATQRAF